MAVVDPPLPYCLRRLGLDRRVEPHGRCGALGMINFPIFLFFPLSRQGSHLSIPHWTLSLFPQFYLPLSWLLGCKGSVTTRPTNPPSAPPPRRPDSLANFPARLDWLVGSSRPPKFLSSPPRRTRVTHSVRKFIKPNASSRAEHLTLWVSPYRQGQIVQMVMRSSAHRPGGKLTIRPSVTPLPAHGSTYHSLLIPSIGRPQILKLGPLPVS
jgi:hypothetical protein